MSLNAEAEHTPNRTTDRADAAADLLWQAWTSGRQLDELPEDVRPEDLDAGWQVAGRVAARAGAAYGWKIAASSALGQARLGIGTPLPGRLFERFRHEAGDTVPIADMHMLIAEAEFAFRMGADVPAGASREQVLDAVEALHLAIELPDTRLRETRRVGSAQLLADSASAGRFVLGPEVAGWRDVELCARAATLWINGAAAGRGLGGAVMGDPRTALVWLADELHRFRTGLRAGEIVTTGTVAAVPAIAAGDALRADFGELGDVEITLA